jgi:sec-independent protein translocase protein TatB
MFNVGGGELLVILLVALIVLGPQRLPEAARTIGKVMGDLRKVSSGFQNEMRSAMNEISDTTTTTARRNVLQKDAPEAAGGVDDAIASVSGDAPPGANGKGQPSPSGHRPRRTRPLQAGDVPPDPGAPRPGP